ncbi:hypothetical protein KHC28_14255 [Ancylobacter sonchi]|uniref:hypothetical protein n=1 Tax=Ancylobacter sonchi TaxID=1937790 RepID=UPI001BD325AE|nr:hypothetical protein [Ancylobacter sonchi]MBS7534822.1 hypothetical protein [Ancylobacter sonchi]
MRKHLICAVFVFPLAVQPANADFFGDVWGVVTDPFKIGRASENIVHAVERAAIHISRIQKDIDSSAEARINQIQGVLRDTKLNLDDSIDKALTRISSISDKLFLDTSNLVRCSTEEAARSIQDHLSQSLNDLGRRKPRIAVFGWTILTAEIDSQDITSPIASFREVKAIYDQKISAISPSDHPSKLTDYYAEIARLARLTACHYHNDSNTWLDLYDDYQLEYIRQQKYWTNIKPI